MRKAFFALLLLLPASALAQYSRFEITPTAGYRFSGRVRAVDDNGFVHDNSDLRVDEKGIYGVTLDIPLAYSWKLELLANHQATSFSLDSGLFQPRVRLGDVDIDYLQIGLLYQWGRGQVNPYFTGSLGVARIDPKFGGTAENRFAGSLAGGVKIFFSRNVGLRLEARGYYASLDTRTEDVDSEGHHHHTTVNEGLYQGEASAGLILAW
ncbi:MAG TPA: outer membrane beta-barrel protein [Thermoanaerobaculia bacterium]|nr:outer membrane beta-barrel protein [Thermoanaerobaculia bacterium]